MNAGAGAIIKKYAFFIIAAVFFICALGFILRPVWFDEALTFGLLMKRNTPSEIYFSYEIPNNHIVYSVILSLWIKTVRFFSEDYPLWLLRIPSLAAGAVSLFLLYRVMLRRASLRTAFACAVLCGGAFPFIIYATALRGYIFAFLFTLIIFILTEKILEKHLTWPHYLLFCALSLLTVGIAPTNLAALAGVTVFFTPDFTAAKRYRELIFLCGAVLLSVPVFYLGILRELAACSQLGEGWHSASHAAFNLYGAFVLAFLPVLLALASRLRGIRKDKLNFRLVCDSAVFAMPLVIWCVFPAPPFPRVFFPFFGLWLTILAGCLKDTGKAVVLLSLGWVAVLYNVSHQTLSDALFGQGGRTDDLVSPYYVRTSFKPFECAEMIQQYLGEYPASTVFVTFEADYPAVMFHLTNLYPDKLPENIIFDRGGEFKVKSLPRNGRLLIVHSGGRDLTSTCGRFGIYDLPRIIEPPEAGMYGFAEFIR